MHYTFSDLIRANVDSASWNYSFQRYQRILAARLSAGWVNEINLKKMSIHYKAWLQEFPQNQARAPKSSRLVNVEKTNERKNDWGVHVNLLSSYGVYFDASFNHLLLSLFLSR